MRHKRCNDCGPIYKVKRCIETEEGCVKITKERENLKIKPGDTLTEALDNIELKLGKKTAPDDNLYEFNNIGTGEELLVKNSNYKYSLKTLKSQSIEIDSDEEGNILLEAPTGVKNYIVNNNYEGQKREGTELNPFITIKEAIKTIEGEVGYDNTQGKKVFLIIRMSDKPYYIDDTEELKADFSIRNLTVIIDPHVIIEHNSSDPLIDLDKMANFSSENKIIMLSETSTININKSTAFKNKGRRNYTLNQLPKEITIEGGRVNLNGDKLDTDRALFKGNTNKENIGKPKNGYHPNIRFKNTTIYSKLNRIFETGKEDIVLTRNCRIIYSDPGDDITSKDNTIIYLNEYSEFNSFQDEYWINGTTALPYIKGFINVNKDAVVNILHGNIKVNSLYHSLIYLNHFQSYANIEHTEIRGYNLISVLKYEEEEVNDKCSVDFCNIRAQKIVEGNIDNTAPNEYPRSRLNKLNDFLKVKVPRYETYTEAERDLPFGTMFLNRRSSTDANDFALSVITEEM